MHKLLTIILLGAAFIACDRIKRADTIAIIPQPVQINIEKGEFIINGSVTVTFPTGDAELEKAANFIANTLGAHVKASTIRITDATSDHAINLERWSDASKAEAYKLEVSDDEIDIKAADYSGAIYAMQTLLQLLPESAYDSIPTQQKYAVPAIEITDYPRFAWRGMHLDCVRHFFTIQEVKQYIDLLAMHKLNRFHWHLTDDQGWRMESKKYPLLTEKSAWRVDRTSEAWDGRKPIDRTAGEKPTYGGFYTQNEIRDLVAYAEALGVTVIPEIEIPGHSSEVFAAYPSLSCLGVEQEVTPGGYYPDEMATCYCAGNEEVFHFLEDILDETCELFPNAPYIHIGGDEVDKKFWKHCPKCQARMQAEGLETMDELQSYFMKRIVAYMTAKGRKVIGWDEILDGGLAPGAAVMSWRGISGGIAAAQQNHQVVMTPGSHLYFDSYQNTPESEPKAFGGFNTTRNVYAYEPIPDALTADQASCIMGAQANLWCECIPTFTHVQYMAVPRMSALAEVVWSTKESRNWDDFSRRLATQQRRFKAKGINAHHGADAVNFEAKYDATTKKFIVTMISEIYGADIHYTMDGTAPTTTSPKYTEAISIDKTVNFQAVTVLDGKVLSQTPTTRMIGMHKAIGKKVTYNSQPDPAYMASGSSTLVDGFTGTNSHSDGFSQGFNGQDFDITIDLEQPTKISDVTGSFTQSASAWIYMPKEMIVSLSDDGKIFRKVGKAESHLDPVQIPSVRKTLSVKLNNTARYVRIIGGNFVASTGLPGAGHTNWIFADEIFIN